MIMPCSLGSKMGWQGACEVADDWGRVEVRKETRSVLRRKGMGGEGGKDGLDGGINNGLWMLPCMTGSALDRRG